MEFTAIAHLSSLSFSLVADPSREIAPSREMLECDRVWGLCSIGAIAGLS
ncbi:MAG: hypothetical protein VKJ46_13585 [Leptolyngbyaceae bacterium]|nr:hypothetical protein [Leptolyngbyaceae bacterium]